MKLPGGDYSVYAAYRGNKQEIFAPDGKLDFFVIELKPGPLVGVTFIWSSQK